MFKLSLNNYFFTKKFQENSAGQILQNILGLKDNWSAAKLRFITNLLLNKYTM